MIITRIIVIIVIRQEGRNVTEDRYDCHEQMYVLSTVHTVPGRSGEYH